MGNGVMCCLRLTCGVEDASNIVTTCRWSLFHQNMNRRARYCVLGAHCSSSRARVVRCTQEMVGYKWTAVQLYSCILDVHVIPINIRLKQIKLQFSNISNECVQEHVL